MKIKQTNRFSLGVSAALLMLGVAWIMPANDVSADPATSSIKCSDGTRVSAFKDSKPDRSILDDKDYEYACRNNDGYRNVEETIICNDGSMRSVFKDAADPKDKLNNADREKACAAFGGIKEDVTDMGDGDGGGFTGTNRIDGDDCGGVETAFIKCSATNSGTTEDNGIWALLLIALNILTAGVGILAVGGIVYGSILYTTAEDKADQVKKATDIITNVVIGLILFAFMWAGLNFIVPGGVFQ
jgi:hypothetical protein